MHGLVVDEDFGPGTHIGPVVDATQLEQDLSYVAIGQCDGAKLAAGGQRPKRATRLRYGVGSAP
jgi:alpha-ketoglutaric semialdehyde dehydrogenase